MLRVIGFGLLWMLCCLGWDDSVDGPDMLPCSVIPFALASME